MLLAFVVAIVSVVLAAPEALAQQQREVEIAFYSDRAARDPLGAADRARLAALYLARARATGNDADLGRAEELARASLRLREAHNASTYALLASILMAQHRFLGARDAARRADEMEPGLPSHRALRGEISMELGDYDHARALFESLRGVVPDTMMMLPAAPVSDAVSLRLARWYEVSGRLDWAARRLQLVRADWDKVPDAPPDQLAWLHLRIAEVAAKRGLLAEADSSIARGLRRAPGDHRLLGAAAKLAARRGRWREAIDYGEAAIAISLEPAILGLLSDAWLARRDTAKAEQYATVMRTVVAGAAGGSGFPHRSWSLWLLDRDLEIPAVLARARAELGQRKDVYGYDLYAWALYKAGRHREAWTAMQRALRMGTQDPMLERHAAAIRLALDEVAAP